MKKTEKTNEELLKELQLLREENEALKSAYQRDISAQKKTAQELKESNEIADEFIRKFYKLAELLPGYISYVNANTLKYEFVNKTYQKSFGLPYEKIVGSHVKDIIGEENFNFALKYINIVKEGKTASYENVFKMVEGNRWIKVNYAPEFDKNGNVASIIVLTYDITEQKEADLVIKQKNDELAELNASKDKFFSIIAHDLRSPFSGFLGLTKLMSENINDFTLNELQEQSKNMQSSAINLYELLENLLEWSRMQRGLVNFNPEQCSLNQIITHNVEIAEEIANRKNIDIKIKVPDDLFIIADISMINSVIRNLISNAIKFTHRAGSIEIGSWISASSGKSEICIYVKDSGIGISKDRISKLFKIGEKVSLPGTDDEPSSGLGLLLCKEFIEKHGGRIWVESEVDKGSTFCFSLGNKK